MTTPTPSPASGLRELEAAVEAIARWHKDINLLEELPEYKSVYDESMKRVEAYDTAIWDSELVTYMAYSSVRETAMGTLLEAFVAYREQVGKLEAFAQNLSRYEQRPDHESSEASIILSAFTKEAVKLLASLVETEKP